MTGRHGRWNAQRLVWAAVMSHGGRLRRPRPRRRIRWSGNIGLVRRDDTGHRCRRHRTGFELCQCGAVHGCRHLHPEHRLRMSTFAPLVESWNGSSWSLGPQAPVPPGDGGGLFDVSCVNGADCWAVGAVLGVAGNGNPSATLIENWNGSSWSIVPSPTPTGPDVQGAVLQGVQLRRPRPAASPSASRPTTRGPTSTPSSSSGTDAAWTLVPAADTGQAFEQLSGVTCVAAADCWAVGNAGPVQQNPNFLPIFPGAVGDQGLIEHWDGSSWSVVPSATEPSPNGGFLYGVTCVDAADCWASGATTDTSGMASGLLLQHWNGSQLDRRRRAPFRTRRPEASSAASPASARCSAGRSVLWDRSAAGGGGNFRRRRSSRTGTAPPGRSSRARTWPRSASWTPSPACGRWRASPPGARPRGQQENDPGLRTLVEQMTFPPASSQGLALSARDGGVFTYGTAQFVGSMGGTRLNAPVVGIADDAGRRGLLAGGSRRRRLQLRRRAVLRIDGWTTTQCTGRRHRQYPRRSGVLAGRRRTVACSASGTPGSSAPWVAGHSMRRLSDGG